MLKSPAYIHFRVQWQLLGPESPGQRFDRQLFHDFLTSLNRDPKAGDYDDFSYRSDRCELAKVRGTHPRGAEAFSKVLYTNDQLTIVEELAEIGAEAFGQKLVAVLAAWFRHFPQTLAVMERCWLRALMEPTQFKDSREFIGNRVLRLGEHLAGSFVQMPHQVGFAVGCKRGWEKQTLFIDTKVNSWRDSRSVWMEVACMTSLMPPINFTSIDRAQVPFTKCKEFLEGEVIQLLGRLDSTPESKHKNGGNQ